MPDRGIASGKRCTKLAFTMQRDVSFPDLDGAISAVDDFDPASYTPFGLILTRIGREVAS